MSDWLTRDTASVWHPFTPDPVLGPREMLVRAKGAFVETRQGRRLFDATSSWWCQVHGHGHPRLVSAMAKQAETLDHVLFAPHTHEPGVLLAEALIRKLGAPISKIFYSDDGSTAVEAALKMCLQGWIRRGERRDKFLAIDRAYHGDTMGAVRVSHVGEFHRDFESLSGVFRGTAPYCYRCPLGLKYPSCEVKCAEEAERVLERHHREIAAFIAEPLVLGAAGMIVYPKSYLERIMALCRRYDIPVILDEVFTGFGRTGTFFALEQLSEKPDIVCLSKGLTSGMLPLAVTAVSDRVLEPFRGGADRAFFHGHTFSGNPIACRVALESLALFEQERVLERNGRLMNVMDSEARRFSELPGVGEVRRLGMIWAAELVEDRVTRRAPDPLNGRGWRTATAAWERGVWIRPLHNVLYVLPPYCASESDLLECFSVLYSEVNREYTSPQRS